MHIVQHMVGRDQVFICFIVTLEGAIYDPQGSEMSIAQEQLYQGHNQTSPGLTRREMPSRTRVPGREG